MSKRVTDRSYALRELARGLDAEAGDLLAYETRYEWPHGSPVVDSIRAHRTAARLLRAEARRVETAGKRGRRER